MTQTTDQPGRLERYTIDRKLSQGGMAEVYLAHHVDADRKKPVVITWSGRVTVIDFGVAKATSLDDQGLTRAGQVKGKMTYMSPEQVTREPLDCRSDLFSVGIILWELLTQRRLFARKQWMESMT